MLYHAMVTREGKRRLIEFVDAPGCQTFADPDENLVAVATDALTGWLEAWLEDEADAPPRPKAAVHARAKATVLAVRVPAILAAHIELRWAREAKGISQAELARRVGVTRQALAKLEQPGKDLQVGTLERAAQALGLAVDLRLVAD